MATCENCAHQVSYHDRLGCSVFPCACPSQRRAAAVDQAIDRQTIKPDPKQVGGSHYLRAIQIWDIVEVWELGYFRGSVLKYLLRAGNKGSKVEDLKKARHFLDRAIEIAEREG
jgi:hypothetical protein